MKVNISNYPNWFGPYQLAEKLCFWAKDVEDKYGCKSKPDWVHSFGEWLAYGSIKPEPKVGEITSWNEKRSPTWLNRFLGWVDNLKKRKMYIHIDPWDTWNMDRTLAHIILPMLKQLKETKHGVPCNIDLEDVPENLRVHERGDDNWQQMELFDIESLWEPESNNWIALDQWNYILDEMIFAFEHHTNDLWEEEFHSGKHDIRWKCNEDGSSTMVIGENDTHKCDYEGLHKVHARITNGFRLFGKYYQNLWD